MHTRDLLSDVLLEQSVLRTKAQEKDIVISELESQIKELKEREKYSESVLSKEKQKYEEQLQQKDREINRLQCEYKDERSTLTQKVEFAEQYSIKYLLSD